MVMSESAKWRSGREGERTRGTLPSGRGGKSPRPLRHQKGVAAQDDRDVMVPAGEAAAFEVVEAELALELLVNPLCLVPLLDEPHDLLLGHATRQRRERELGWR